MQLIVGWSKIVIWYIDASEKWVKKIYVYLVKAKSSSRTKIETKLSTKVWSKNYFLTKYPNKTLYMYINNMNKVTKKNNTFVILKIHWKTFLNANFIYNAHVYDRILLSLPFLVSKPELFPLEGDEDEVL